MYRFVREFCSLAFMVGLKDCLIAINDEILARQMHIGNFIKFF